MALRDIGLRDFLRVGAILQNKLDDPRNPPVSVILEAMTQEAARKIDADPASITSMPVAIAPELRKIAEGLRDLIAEKYGNEYADDLIARLRR